MVPPPFSVPHSGSLASRGRHLPLSESGQVAVRRVESSTGSRHRSFRILPPFPPSFIAAFWSSQHSFSPGYSFPFLGTTPIHLLPQPRFSNFTSCLFLATFAVHEVPPSNQCRRVPFHQPRRFPILALPPHNSLKGACTSCALRVARSCDGGALHIGPFTSSIPHFPTFFTVSTALLVAY